MLTPREIRNRKKRLVEFYREPIWFIVIQRSLYGNEKNSSTKDQLLDHLTEIIKIMVKTVKVEPWPDDIRKFAPLIDRIINSYFEDLT